jgi:putative transposase
MISPPTILNGDQVSHLACEEYIDYLKSNGIQLSIDGKGRALRNIFIKGFWRTIKYQYIYLNPSASEVDLFIGIKK